MNFPHFYYEHKYEDYVLFLHLLKNYDYQLFSNLQTSQMQSFFHPSIILLCDSDEIDIQKISQYKIYIYKTQTHHYFMFKYYDDNKLKYFNNYNAYLSLNNKNSNKSVECIYLSSNTIILKVLHNKNVKELDTLDILNKYIDVYLKNLNTLESVENLEIHKEINKQDLLKYVDYCMKYIENQYPKYYQIAETLYKNIDFKLYDSEEPIIINAKLCHSPYLLSFSGNTNNDVLIDFSNLKKANIYLDLGLLIIDLIPREESINSLINIIGNYFQHLGVWESDEDNILEADGKDLNIENKIKAKKTLANYINIAALIRIFNELLLCEKHEDFKNTIHFDNITKVINLKLALRNIKTFSTYLPDNKSLTCPIFFLYDQEINISDYVTILYTYSNLITKYLRN
ncbi:hypothetical protein AB837_00293 [bacterium AB1]|nr:hypothetical protein AB837_00293 [bacterium AB1]